jgi:universal stress protein A
MSAWRSLCCAVDLSEASRLAMREAADLARRGGGALTLVHVHQPPAAVAPAAFEEAEDRAERLVEAWREEAERLAGRTVRAVLLVGDPAPELLRWIDERRPDVLVTGSHGRTGLARLMLGSVAERLVRHASCPVLVVRAQPEREPAGAGARA